MAFLQLKTYSEALRTKTSIQVILPTPLVGDPTQAYYDSDKKVPCLYLLHGTYGDEGDYTRFSRIESYAQEYHVAVVMMEAENSCYRDMPRGGPAFYTYITEELPKMMEWMFPISNKREDRFLCGLSMGGTGAFKLAFTRPDVFGSVACMSANFDGWQEKADAGNSVWSLAFEPGAKLAGTDEDMYHVLDQAIASGKKLPDLYVCIGRQDFLYQSNVKFEKYLNSKCIPHVYHEQPGIHNWDFWDDELRRILAWLPIQRRDSKNWF